MLLFPKSTYYAIFFYLIGPNPRRALSGKKHLTSKCWLKIYIALNANKNASFFMIFLNDSFTKIPLNYSVIALFLHCSVPQMTNNNCEMKHFVSNCIPGPG